MLFGSTHDVTYHYQRILNYAARVILCLQKLSSLTTHIKLLHWLPVKVRRCHNIACFCYHCYCCAEISYVADMLMKKPSQAHNTRTSSSTMTLYNRLAHSMATHGDLLFSFASFSVWNCTKNDDRCVPSLSLPNSCLKTY